MQFRFEWNMIEIRYRMQFRLEWNVIQVWKWNATEVGVECGYGPPRS